MQERVLVVPPRFAATLAALNANVVDAQARLDLAVAGMLAGAAIERAQVLAVDAQSGTVTLAVPPEGDDGA